MNPIHVSSTEGHTPEGTSRKRNSIQTKFLQVFQEIFDQDDAANMSVLDDFISRHEKPVFQPNKFGLDKSVKPIVNKVFQTFGNLEFEGSVGYLKKMNKKLCVRFQEVFNQSFKASNLSTYHEIRVEFGLNFKMRVVNDHPRKLEMEHLLNEHHALNHLLQRICILSEFTRCTKGIEDFQALYRLAPQRAVDMFSDFLRSYSEAEFGFRVARKKVTWYFEEAYSQYIE